jgi:hypothetical protein
MLYPKVTSAKPLDAYKVALAFETGEQKVFDVSPYIKGDWYGMLRDANFFRTVRPSGRTIAWADGQDIAPHELYEYSVPV